MSIPTPDQQQRALLAEALQLSRYLVSSGGSDADAAVVERRRSRLRQLQTDLTQLAHPICRDRRESETIPLDVRQAFVRAVLLVTRYHQVGGIGWQGTLPSQTLSKYRPDPIPPWLKERHVIADLCRLFQIPPDFEVELKSTLQTIDSRVQKQRYLIEAILRDAGITPEIQPQDQAVSNLFKNLFGGIEIPPAKIHCIYTPLQIYFCLEFPDSDGAKSVNGWEQVSDDDRQRLSQLQQTLKTFSFAKFQSFPTFGPCNPAHIDVIWANHIAQQIGKTVPEIVKTLSQNVGVLPMQDAETFLIHDIWGHYWQLVLTQFEGDYTILADCDQPLRAAETAYTPQGPLTCQELFVVDDKQVSIDAARARLFFHGEVRQRLGLLFTHLLGEMVADAAEFKFVWNHPQSAHELPSSSIFKDHPTNLDLSLTDLDFLFLRVLKPLLAFQVSVAEPSPLENDLLAKWDSQDTAVDSLELQIGLKRALLDLYQIFLDEYNAAYLPTLHGDIGLFSQIVSNLLYLQNVINSLYTDPLLATQRSFPFQDLLLVFISSYCSSDSYDQFWRVDDVIASYFVPCWYCLFDRYVAEKKGL